MQSYPHAGGLGVGKHDELDVGRRLVVVQLVLAGPVANEAGGTRVSLVITDLGARHVSEGRGIAAPVILSPQLAHHVPQREDGAEDELRIVIRTTGLAS